MADAPGEPIRIDEALVRALLVDQHPDLADRPIAFVAEGWDNRLFRVGDDLGVRLPRRVEAVLLTVYEHRWLAEVAAGLPLPAPIPVRTGAPGAGYPWPWSVVPWFDGRSGLEADLVDPVDAGRRLGGFVAELHRPAPADAPHNPYRGIPVADRTPQVDAALATIAERGRALGVDVTARSVREAWDRLAVGTPEWAGSPRWLHGDLHPGNLVVRDGALVAVVDWGDLTSGDPATDLAAAFLLLPSDARRAFREAAHRDDRPVDDAMWRRAEAWAVAFGVAYIAGSPDGAPHIALGQRVLAELAPAR